MDKSIYLEYHTSNIWKQHQPCIYRLEVFSAINFIHSSILIFQRKAVSLLLESRLYSMERRHQRLVTSRTSKTRFGLLWDLNKCFLAF